MKPQTIGRVLGIGVRVAGRMAGQRLAATSVAETRPAAPVHAAVGEGAPKPASGGVAARRAGVAAGAVGRGVGGFLRPFRRVGNIVFLEVVGVFFLLFAVGFGSWAWRLRAQAVQGPEHAKFLAYAAMTLVF